MSRIIYDKNGGILRQVKKDSVLNTIRKRFEKSWALYTSIIVTILTVLSAIRKFTIYKYYGIDFLFFNYNIQEIFVSIFSNSIILLIVLIIPILTKEIEPEDGMSKIGKFITCILMAILLGCKYAKQIIINQRIENNIVINIIFISIVLIFIMGLHFAYYNFNITNFKENMTFIRGASIILGSFCCIILYGIIVLSTISNLIAIDIRNKYIYPEIKYNNKEYCILIMQNDKAFIAKVDQEKIDCRNYIIIDPEGYQISEKRFELPPEIIKK